MSGLNVLIAGASVAGPMTAYWLAKAGAKITVLERFPSMRKGGQNIDIRATGVTVMRRIPGMEAAVRAKTTTIEGFGMIDAQGKPFAVIRPTGNPDQQSIISEFEIFRDDLSEILLDLTRDHPNITYKFGDQIASMQQSGDGKGPIKVTFQNGLPSAEYDLIVAADGATSRTRAMAFGCGVRDHLKTRNAWVTFFTSTKDFLQGSKLGVMYNATGGRGMGLGPDPAGGSRVMITKIEKQDGGDNTAEFRRARDGGEKVLKEYIAQHYHDIGWKAEELIESMMGATEFYGSEMVHVQPPSLYNDRVALVGDSGYGSAFTGTGTTLAMTGGYVLAGEIAAHQGDLAAGLKAYEETMKPLVDKLRTSPPGFASLMGPQTALGLWIRNMFMWALISSGILNLIGKLFGGASMGDNMHKLPEYKF